ncbi:MAG: SAM-dependent methyltransferase [Phycisphaerae bacterium]
MASVDQPYVSRAGVKLEAALRAFALPVEGLICCDFGSHVGGFVDCLLRHGAARVHSVDTGYGVLAYRLRKDPRVVAHERRNAIHFVAPEPCDLITMDVGWTRLRLVLPAARRCLKRGAAGVVALVKPQYEAPAEWLHGGVLVAEKRANVLAACRDDVESLAWRVAGEIESPIRGQGGNAEWLWHLRDTAAP